MQLDWQRLFLRTDGRLGRQDFWIGALIVSAAGWLLGHIPILGILAILLIWPQICLGAKRLHDMGRSAVLLVLPYAVMAACWVVAMVIGGLAGIIAGGLFGVHAGFGVGIGVGGVIMGAGYLVCLAFTLWIGLSPSQPGENQYGEPQPSAFGPAPPPI